MRRVLVLVTVVVLAVVAAFLWTRDDTTQPATPELARPAEEVRDAKPVDLAAPSAKPATDSRTEIVEAAPTPPATTPTPASTWTGIRVRTVSRETRAPIAGVFVSARATGSRQPIRSVQGSRGTITEMPSTDKDGYAELVLDAGFTGKLHASGIAGVAGWGEHAVETPLTPGEVRAIEIALPTTLDLVLHGRVIDRETNAPIAGARLGPSEGLGKIRASAEQITDDDGRFRVEGATWHPHVVQVIATGYEIAALRVSPGFADPATALEIALSRVATARITATAADGSPIAGKRVTLSTAGYRFGRPDGSDLISSGWINEARYNSTTDAAGRAFFADLPPRMPLDAVMTEGRDELYRAPDKISLEPGELREFAWKLGTGCAIHGIALEESGAPAAGLAIALELARMQMPTHFRSSGADKRRSAKTDAEGRFTFAAVAPGDWWVGVAPPPRASREPAGDDAPAPAAQFVAVADGPARVDVTIRVARGHRIRGRLLDPDGKAVGHSFVAIERAADKFLTQENVNSTDGDFVLGPLEPGEYVLRGSAMGEFADALPVTARTGDTNVVIQFRRGGAIAGVVLVADGKPAERADLVLNPRVVNRWSNMSSAAGADGRFEFEGLEEGVYDLAARTADGRIGVATAIEVRAGEKPAETRIETRPGARVRVRYDGPKPHIGISVLQDGVTVHADGVEKGTESTFAVPAGSCVVRALQYPERTETDLRIELAAGETRDLVFDGAWK